MHIICNIEYTKYYYVSIISYNNILIRFEIITKLDAM